MSENQPPVGPFLTGAFLSFFTLFLMWQDELEFALIVAGMLVVLSLGTLVILS